MQGLGGHVVLERPAAGPLAKRRRVEVAVEGERQRARDGRRGHHEQVGDGALAAQRQTLVHAEPVLLVHDREREVAELDALLHEGVRAEGHLHGAVGDRRE